MRLQRSRPARRRRRTSGGTTNVVERLPGTSWWSPGRGVKMLKATSATAAMLSSRPCGGGEALADSMPDGALDAGVPGPRGRVHHSRAFRDRRRPCSRAFRKYASRIWIAAAAVSAPKPPSSIVTAMTIRGCRWGRPPCTRTGRRAGRSAVPVLPATSIGKLPNTRYEVPSRARAAWCSPSKGSPSGEAGSIWTWRRGCGWLELPQDPARPRPRLPCPTWGVTIVPPFPRAA